MAIKTFPTLTCHLLNPSTVWLTQTVIVSTHFLKSSSSCLENPVLCDEILSSPLCFTDHRGSPTPSPTGEDNHHGKLPAVMSNASDSQIAPHLPLHRR